MIERCNYLVVLKRQDGSSDVFIPSLERPENTACVRADVFANNLSSQLGQPCEVLFTSVPAEFGVIGVNCNIDTADKLQTQMPEVANVLPIHKACIEDPWDLLPHLNDDNTRKAFAEIRKARRSLIHF